MKMTVSLKLHVMVLLAYVTLVNVKIKMIQRFIELLPCLLDLVT